MFSTETERSMNSPFFLEHLDHVSLGEVAPLGSVHANATDMPPGLLKGKKREHFCQHTSGITSETIWKKVVKLVWKKEKCI